MLQCEKLLFINNAQTPGIIKDRIINQLDPSTNLFIVRVHVVLITLVYFIKYVV